MKNLSRCFLIISLHGMNKHNHDSLHGNIKDMELSLIQRTLLTCSFYTTNWINGWHILRKW